MIFNNSYNSIVITTPYLEGDHPKILYANRAFLQMTGYPKEEIIGQTPRILQGDKTDRKMLDELKACLLREEYFEGKTINYTKEGKEYWVEWNISPVYDKNKTLVAFLSLQKDITVQQNLLNHIKLFQEAVDQNQDAIALFDTNGNYVYANRSYLHRTGYGISELIGKRANILKSGHHDGNFYEKLWQQLLAKNPFEAEFTNKDAKGSIYYEKQTITPILEKERLVGFVSIGKNYDKEHAQHAQLREDVYKDSLTGLFNKKAFHIKFNKAADHYATCGAPFSMVIIDLDNFKHVNDTLGHDKGDRVLEEYASFLKNNVRSSDEIFRFGGDEFVILLYSTHEAAAQFCYKLESLFLESDIARTYGIGMSLGFKEYQGQEQAVFFKLADDAMYAMKKNGPTKTTP
jgi:diguanylate cyclase (GGDEF)-like protein/PAS domain S-box-containing protein